MANRDEILVIDDDRAVCELVSGLARTMGLKCTTTDDPATFLDRVSPETTLIVLDLMMPGMDGIEVLRLLGERRCKAHILLMSGMDRRVLETAEKLATSLGLVVAGHLQKPFPLPELQEVLMRLASMEKPELHAESPRLAIPDGQMKDAIDREEFLNFYQPQINLTTGRVMGVEALARWQHPELGLVLPESFIGRIESMGLIDKLCWSTARLALSETKQFRGSNGELQGLSLNASMHSLDDLEFPDRLMNMARRLDFPVEKIVIEVTESGLAKRLSRTLDVLARLRMKGFQLSIDDFGSGYAMMRQLQNVPATELKIDMSIVENMHVSDSDRVMVEKIIEMGHELGMRVIAEGVTRQEQYDLLRSKGCDGAQGYLFSRPLPTSEMVKWLSAHELRWTSNQK